jgi:histidyl-tRNA synthetase
MAKPDKIPTRPTKGMRDFFPEDYERHRWLFESWREVAESFGFQAYDAPILESEALYVRKAGDEITQQLYGFADKGNRRLALRPEMTPSLARMIIGRGGSLMLPARWYSIPQCFRYERTQKGRTREHYQWNMDVVGLASVAAEVELMSAQHAFLAKAGFKVEPGAAEIVFRVSNRKVLEHFLSSRGVEGEAFKAACIVVDKKDKIGPESTATELASQGISAEVTAELLELLEVKGLDALRQVAGDDNPGVVQLAELCALADAAKIGSMIEIDISVVRGLSYYTGTVWELFDTAGDVPRSIAGGGRYDKLLSSLGGPDLPMVGFGFGDVVIDLLLKDRGLYPEPSARVQDVVYPMGSTEFDVATRIATKLRAAGRKVLVDYSERRFKHVVKNAEAQGAGRLFVLGSDEVEAGVVRVRSLSESRDETKEPLADWVD